MLKVTRTTDPVEAELTYLDVLDAIQDELRLMTCHCVGDADYEVARKGLAAIEAVNNFREALPNEAQDAKYGNPWETQR